MSYTEKHLDQVDSYLSRPGRNGDGPPHLSKEGQTDPSLKEAMKDVQMVWQATRLEKLQGKLEMLKEFEREIQAKAEEENSGKVVSLGRRKWIMGMAAGVLLLIAVGWFLFRGQGPQEIQHQYLAMHFDEYVLHDVMKGDEQISSVTAEQQRAYDLFAVRAFDRAIPLLKKEWEESHDSLSLFYLWVSYIAVGDEDARMRYKDNIRDIATQSQEMNNLLERLSH